MPEVAGPQKMYDVGYGKKKPATPDLERTLNRLRDAHDFEDKMNAKKEMDTENSLRRTGLRPKKEGAQKDPVEAMDITKLQAHREDLIRESKRLYPTAISPEDEEKEKDPGLVAAKQALDEQYQLIERKKGS